MEKIKINGKEYEIKEINFKALKTLEQLGFTMNVFQNLGDNYYYALSCLVAFTIDKDVVTADEEIDKHISNGGSVMDFTPLFESLSKSDFFRNLSKQQSEQTKI